VRPVRTAASGDAPFAVQSSWAKTNAAKSTSRVSSTSRARVETPGLKTVVHSVDVGDVLKAPR
jgi:hypothetical protein